jgi:hypothetical protein
MIFNSLSDSFTKKIVAKLDEEMDAQEVKNWTQRIVLVKITLIKGGENEHWDYGRIKS